MVIFYVVILVSQIVVRCDSLTGCTQVSYAHFQALLAGGLLELCFEVPFAAKFYSKITKKKKKE